MGIDVRWIIAVIALVVITWVCLKSRRWAVALGVAVAAAAAIYVIMNLQDVKVLVPAAPRPATTTHCSTANVETRATGPASTFSAPSPVASRTC